MASRIQIRRDTAANWTSANPSLLAGELCYETDSGRMKIGTGANWSSTDYFVYEDTKLAELLDVTITGAAAGDFLRYNNSSSVWYNDAVNLATDTIGDYVESLVAGTGLTITNNSGEGSTPTLAIGQAVGTSASVTFAQVTLGNEPSASNHAVTKQYVDAVSAGINWHLSAKLATATILPFAPNYSNGTSGVGATLTSTENGRLSIDGVNATTGDRVLVKNQSSALQNGIYVVTAQGSASAVYVLTRTVDFDGSVDDYIVRGDALYVGSGSVNGNQGFIVNSVGTYGENLAHVVGTDDITFTQFTGTSNIIAGTGVTKTGNTLSIGQDVATSASVTFARVYGEFTGNADTATTLATPRNIQLAGAVTGTVPFNGSASVEILTTMNSTLGSLTDVSASAPGENAFLKWVNTGWEPDVINLGTDTTGNYMVDLTQGTGVTITHTPGEGSNATIAIGQDVGTSASVTFGQVTAPLIGNASTATTLQTSRNIAGQAFNGSADISIAPTDLTGVTATASEINVLDGITSSTAELNILDGVTASTAELNILDGATLSTTELNYVDGVTSAIQTQIDSKAPSASPTFTGVVTLPDNTVALGTKTTGDYVASLVAGTGVTLTNNSGETATPTVAIGQAVGTSASVTFSNITATGVVTLAADPASALQAATKQYVDNIVSGINFHEAVVGATTGNLAGTYNNGTSGIGATITKASNGSIGTIDGATVVVGSRILLKSQTDSKQNGIYTITAVGSVSAPWVVTRATDADNSLSGEMTNGDFCFVMGGNTNAGYGFVNNSPTNPIVIGTDNITYSAFNAAQTITAGTGLDLTSNVMSLNATLDNLSNVTAPSPTDGHFLKYVSASTAWIPASIPTINALDDIGNVSASAPVDNSPLTWSTSASAWVANSQSLTLGEPGTTDYLTISPSGISSTTSAGENFTVSPSSVIATNGTGGPYFNLNVNNVTFSNGTDQFMIDPYWGTSGQVLAFTPGGGSGGTWGPTTLTLNNIADVSTNARTASYTLVLTDKNKIVEMGVGSANTLTVPLNSSVAFPVGSQINILQTGSGQTTITATGGVTINATPGLKMRAQWSYATLVKRAENTWVLVGDISA